MDGEGDVRARACRLDVKPVRARIMSEIVWRVEYVGVRVLVVEADEGFRERPFSASA